MRALSYRKHGAIPGIEAGPEVATSHVVAAADQCIIGTASGPSATPDQTELYR
jgi:hypothetical protein